MRTGSGMSSKLLPYCSYWDTRFSPLDVDFDGPGFGDEVSNPEEHERLDRFFDDFDLLLNNLFHIFATIYYNVEKLAIHFAQLHNNKMIHSRLNIITRTAYVNDGFKQNKQKINKTFNEHISVIEYHPSLIAYHIRVKVKISLSCCFLSFEQANLRKSHKSCCLLT